jgi:hypothetical protein
MADPDLDGVVNWIERALGRDPLQAEGDTAIQVFPVNLSGTPYLEISYPRLLGGIDEGNGRYRFAEIQYQLEEGTDLLQWDPRDDWEWQSTTPGPGTAWESVLFRLPEALIPGNPRFVRLGLEKVP